MIDVFLVSTGLLCAFLCLFAWEQHRGIRVAGAARYAADQWLLERYANAYRAWTALSTYVRHDMFARTLHMVTYTLLIFVRTIEHRLDVATRFLRAFHRRSLGMRRPPHATVPSTKGAPQETTVE